MLQDGRFGAALADVGRERAGRVRYRRAATLVVTCQRGRAKTVKRADLRALEPVAFCQRQCRLKPGGGADPFRAVGGFGLVQRRIDRSERVLDLRPDRLRTRIRPLRLCPPPSGDPRSFQTSPSICGTGVFFRIGERQAIGRQC